MSSSPTAATSTTRSWSSSSSQSKAGGAATVAVAAAPTPERTVTAAPTSNPAVAVIACGALGTHVREITARRGWQVEVHTLPSLLHNHPERIAPAAERLGRRPAAGGGGGGAGCA